MLKRLLAAMIHRFERRYAYDMQYAHVLLAARTQALLRFLPATWMSSYRADAPLGAWFAVKLAATLYEDCGPCTALVVKMAQEAGLSPATLQAILTQDLAALDEATARGWRYAQAVLTHDPSADTRREEIRAAWGDAALAALALTLTASRVFPHLKYALGYGHACGLVQVGTQVIRVIPMSPLAKGVT